MKISKICFLTLALTLIMSLSLISAPSTDNPVNWRKLTPFLIDFPGWEADGDAEGQTVTMGAYKISNAKRSYKSGDKELDIEIIDGSGYQMIYAAFNMMKNFEIDTSDEYVKKITIDDFPGVEKYEYKDKDAEIMILVAKRFLLKLNAENVKDTAELIKILKKLDLKGLAKLAQ